MCEPNHCMTGKKLSIRFHQKHCLTDQVFFLYPATQFKIQHKSLSNHVELWLRIDGDISESNIWTFTIFYLLIFQNNISTLCIWLSKRCNMFLIPARTLMWPFLLLFGWSKKRLFHTWLKSFEHYLSERLWLFTRWSGEVAWCPYLFTRSQSMSWEIHYASIIEVRINIYASQCRQSNC